MSVKQAQKRQPRVEKEIRAESFVVVDREGRTRARLQAVDSDLQDNPGGAILALHDGNGKLRASFCTSGGGTTLSIFQDVNGEIQDAIKLGLECDTDGKMQPSLKINNGEGENRVWIRLDKKECGELNLFSALNSRTVIDKEGMMIVDNEDNILVELPKLDESPVDINKNQTEKQSLEAARKNARICLMKDRYAALAEAIAAVIERPECPARIYNDLVEFADSFSGLSNFELDEAGKIRSNFTRRLCEIE